MHMASSNSVFNYEFHHIKFRNAKDYAVYIRSANKVLFNECTFNNNGWSGLRMLTGTV